MNERFLVVKYVEDWVHAIYKNLFTGDERGLS